MKKRVLFKAVTGDPNLVVPGELYVEFDLSGNIIKLQKRDTVGGELKDVLFSEDYLQSKAVVYSTNGIKTLAPTRGYKGLKEATVKVDIPLEKNAAFTCEVPSTGGTYNIVPSKGYAGIESAVLNIKIKE